MLPAYKAGLARNETGHRSGSSQLAYHPTLSILCIAESDRGGPNPFFNYLRALPHVTLDITSTLPRELAPYHAVISVSSFQSAQNIAALQQYVTAGGGWLALLDKPGEMVPDLFGVELGTCRPTCELRIVFQNNSHPIARRLPAAGFLTCPYLPLEIRASNAEILLYADWHYQHRPMLVTRPLGNGRVMCTTLQAYENPFFQQILYRCLLHLAGRSDSNRIMGAGILGYAPSVGKLHGLGITATPGLALAAICDQSEERRAQAGQDFPEARIHHTADELADNPQVDLIIIATPPNTHARLSLQMMAAGKHVVCEKPLALTRRESDAMVAMAEKQRVHLCCHQNRRFDVDYRAIRQALNDGLIGDLFYMETFVGGFEHPCGYWHSHEPVSGGTAYDWGGHYLDWIVSLIPDRPTTVIGTRQKRVWHDITNADQERVLIRFAGGQEAEFMHSDIAAIRKPKWYLLGNEGAIIGLWRIESVYELDPVLYYHEHFIPRTEMTPELQLFRRHHSGSIVEQKLALPPRQDFLFHRNLADHLLTGEPLVAPLEQSVCVVTILEAAARSASRGGTIEVINA